MSKRPLPPTVETKSDSLPTVSILNEQIAAVPFNVWLGAGVVASTADGVHLQIPWRTEFSGAPGMTHGGVLASIVDLAAHLALMAASGDGGPTIDMRVDYHRSTVNGPLHALSKVVRVGSTVSTVEVIIRDSEERLIASGRCVFLSRSRGLAARE